MSSILIASIGGVLTLLFWGVSDYYIGKSGQHLGETFSNFFIQFINMVLLIPVVWWYGFSVTVGPLLFVVGAISVCLTLAFILYLRALTIGPFGVAAPLANSYALVTLLIGLMFLGFQTSVPQLLVLTTIIVGVVVLAVDKSTFSLKNFRRSTVYFAGLTALSWGVGFAFMDSVVNQFAWQELLFLVSAGITTLALMYFIATQRALPSARNMSFRKGRYAWYAGVSMCLGAIALFASSAMSGSVIIPVVIGSASPLVTSLLARVIDHERLTLFKRVGVVVIVVGVMLLNIV